MPRFKKRFILNKNRKVLLSVILGSSLVIIGISTLRVLAEGEVTQTWDFSNSGDYTLSDSSKIEVSDNKAKLKIQNYTSDADTMALYHLDETSGTDVSDSSSNNNDGTATTASWTTGNLDNAFSFDGLSKKINVPDSSSLSLTQANTLEAWFKLNSNYSATEATQDYGILDKGAYQLYFDRTSGKITYELGDTSSTSWTQVAGNDINSSWDLNGKLALHAVEKVGDDIYVGLGNAVADAEVWKWDGNTWSIVGGDDVNSSWSDQTFESVFSLATNGTLLYAGLGVTAGDGEVWYCDTSSGCDDWTKIGGDGINSGWAAGTFEGVYSLAYSSGTLYAGTGASANDAEVWSWDGTSWTKIGGDSTNSGWTTGYEIVAKLIANGSNLYASLGSSAGDAEVWIWNGSTWTKLGGDSLNSSWDSTFEQIISMTYANSKLYVGSGTTANDAEVWEWDGDDWTKIGGDSTNSGWTTNYEGVYSLANDGTNVYAGLGSSAGDNELWKWDGADWTKIGGDALNSSFSTPHLIIDALFYDTSDDILYTGVSGSGNNPAELWKFEDDSWSLIGGNYINNSWGFSGLQSVETMESFNGKLYAGTGYTIAGNALVFEFDETSWRVVGGQGVNNSWNAKTYEVIHSMESFEGELYVGLGSTANDSEVWKFNGTTWTQVGGDSLNSGWTTNYETVQSMATFGGNLYVGLGASANDAEVWSWDGTSWTKIGGDSSNSGWTTNYESVYSLVPFNNKLYAGLGASAGDSEVWEWNGTIWTKIGGDTLNSSWGNTIEFVDALAVYDGSLYAGLGSGAGDAQVWKWDGTSWSKIGGDDVLESWTLGTYDRVRALSSYNGRLYAGLGITAGESEVWQYNGITWIKVAGNLENSSWNSAVESVHSLRAHNGKLYAGIGETANVDAAIWTLGDNGFLQSSTSSFDTNWHHVAATYDGTTMKLYIDGVLDNSVAVSLSLPDTSTDLLIGSTFGGTSNGSSQGFFNGKLDEIRISDIARTSFNSTPYSAEAQTVQNSAAVFTEDISGFLNFTVDETTNGGSITYRLSTDGGTTWQYWNGSSWATSSSTSQANSAADIDTNIPTLPISSGGIKWQAILDGNGSQEVTLNSVSIEAQGDTDNPAAPNTLLSALNTSGGPTTIITNTWHTYPTPYFSWNDGTDDGAGVAGYFVYFGIDNTAIPATAGTFQAGTSFSASGLTTGQTYYLRIQTKDNAQNVSPVYPAFIYKYDASAPTNPSTVTVTPSGYASTNSFTFSWPTTGDNMATDVGSQVAGYQYKTGASTGPLSDWSSTTTSSSVVIEEAAYQTNANTFYLRTIDNAGNVSATPLQATYYFAGEGATPPQFLTATPSTNTSNSFAFSWDPPATFTGDEEDLTYCYTINTLPSESTCTFTSAGATSLSASAFATQVGLNTFYLVAKSGEDVGGAINYGSYASVTFTANTSAPGIPLNIEISDVSIKSTEAWRLALSWTTPTDVGSGVSSYQILRSTNGTSFTNLATTTGAAYIDTGLEAITYYYKVKACDSVSNCGASTEEVSLLPTGRFTEPAELESEPEVTNVTTKQATINWSTDRVSDSKIQYGTKSDDYFDEEPSNSAQVTAHEISLTNLKPGTKYYAVAKWTDEDGNTGVSDEFTFSTSPAPVVTDPSLKSSGLNGVTLQFTVKGASKVKVYYGKTSAFGGSVELSTSSAETTYNAVIDELEDGVKYFYKINTFDTEGEEYEGNILSFETLPRPRITNVRIQQVKGSAQPAALISWETNTEVSSIVTYYPQGAAAEAKDEVNVELIKGVHRILLKGLSPETKYTLIVKGIDKAGNEASSDPQTLTTSTDTRPPVISNLRVEGNISKSRSEEATAQLVISWDTDEPSTSQVEFGEGTGTTYSQKTQQDANLTSNHIVIVTGLNTSKVYHLRAISRDKAGNEVLSVDTVTITPKASANALDLVITNLSEAFGFLGSVR